MNQPGKFFPSRKSLLFLLPFFFFLFSFTGKAQWITQTIALEPGWNSVYLEVQPQPDECDTLFAGIEIKSVWDYSREFASVQFIDNPDDLLPTRPDWLVYFPEGSPDRVASNLFFMRAGRSYMIHYAGKEVLQWKVKGIPRPEQFPWVPNAFNLRGFATSDTSPPTFSTFFAPSPAHSGQPIYRLNSVTGRWELIANPDTETMNRGESYWIFSSSPSEYSGPLKLEFDFGNGVDFADILSEYKLRLTNLGSSENVVSIRYMSSESIAQDTGTPLLAGDVPIEYFKFDLTSQEVGFFPLPNPLSLALGKRSTRLLRFQVLRQKMVAFNVPAGAKGLYQGILEVSGDGIKRYIPVTAEGINTRTNSSSLRSKDLRAASPNDKLRRGLWAGTVVVDAVSEVENIKKVKASFQDDFEDNILDWDGTGSPKIVADPDPLRRNNVALLHSTNDGDLKEIKRTASSPITTPEFRFRVRNQDINSEVTFQVFDQSDELLLQLRMAADGHFKNIVAGTEENLLIDTEYELGSWYTIKLNKFLFNNHTYNITINDSFKGTVSFDDVTLDSIQGYAFQSQATAGTTPGDGGYVDNFFAFENPAPANTPTPVSASFQFRVIMHKDRNDQWRILQQVYLQFKEGTLKEDPPGSGINVVDTPGEFVLVTDDDLIDSFSGSTVRDTDVVGRRLSSANFGFDSPIEMSGNTSGNLQLSCTVVLPYDHPLNPFYHRYHPDHNNLNERFSTVLEEGRESFTITRHLRFTFSDTDLDDLAIPGYGDTQLGGRFEDTIEGLHKESITCSGKFRIAHVISTDILNDGLQ